MTVVVERSIDIDAAASTGWAVLSDVERWHPTARPRPRLCAVRVGV